MLILERETEARQCLGVACWSCRKPPVHGEGPVEDTVKNLRDADIPAVHGEVYTVLQRQLGTVQCQEVSKIHSGRSFIVFLGC